MNECNRAFLHWNITSLSLDEPLGINYVFSNAPCICNYCLRKTNHCIRSHLAFANSRSKWAHTMVLQYGRYKSSLYTVTDIQFYIIYLWLLSFVSCTSFARKPLSGCMYLGQQCVSLVQNILSVTFCF